MTFHKPLETMKPPSAPLRPRSPRGLTLLELMVSLGVIGMLMAMALPSYKAHVHKSRRMEAFSQLMSVQMAQERLRSWRNAYADQLNDPDIAQPTLSPSGHYRLSLTRQSGEAYTISATVNAHGAQAGDQECMELQLQVQGGQWVRRAFGRGGQDTTHRCWPT